MFLRHLPEAIFSPFVSKYRVVYAEILTRLHGGPLSLDEPDQPTREEVVADIGEAINRYRAGISPEARDDCRLTASEAFRELLETGWLREIREGWAIYVEMDQLVAMLLDGLCRIGRSEAETFSGTVVSVVSNLEAAVAEPRDRGIGLQEAAVRAKQFARHLRNVIGTLKSIEQTLLGEATVNALARAFFDEFVERIVINDYRHITSNRNNPYRFRQAALRLVDDIESDPELFDPICWAYVQQGIAVDGAAAGRMVAKHIMEVRESFDAIERFRRRLDASKTTIEQRFQNTVEYMDLVETGRADRFLTVLTTFGHCISSAPEDTEIEMVTGLMSLATIFDENKLPEPERPGRPVAPRRYRKPKPDPVWQAFEHAKKMFDIRITLTPSKFNRYVAGCLEGRTEASASDIPPGDIEEFAIFSALRLLNPDRVSLENGIVIEPLPGRVENDWVVCGDFVIRRTIDRAEDAHAD